MHAACPQTCHPCMHAACPQTCHPCMHAACPQTCHPSAHGVPTNMSTPSLSRQKKPHELRVLMSTDQPTYLALYVSTFSLSSSWLLESRCFLAVCGYFRWMTQDLMHRGSTSFLARSPPRDVSYSPQRTPAGAAYSPGRTPANRSMTPSPKVRLWSRYYEPQQ